jgi:hypothetical protein
MSAVVSGAKSQDSTPSRWRIAGCVPSSFPRSAAGSGSSKIAFADVSGSGIATTCVSRRHTSGDPYDDVWAGGWEELFPNDAPGSFEGRTLPDHAEWWARSWSISDSSNQGEARLTLSMTCSVIRASCVKEFVLLDDSPSLTVRYRIRSEEARAFHFLFKQHLPIQLTGDCRLLPRSSPGSTRSASPRVSSPRRR